MQQTTICKLILFFFRYIAIVSGLEIGSKEEQMFPLQLFIDMVTGCLGDVGQQQGAANIVSVIVAGNSLSKDTQDKDSLNKVGMNTTPTSVSFLCLLITFANSLDRDQARQNARPDLDPNCLTLIKKRKF